MKHKTPHPRIAVLRVRANNMTQQQLATAAGLSLSNIKKLEGGEVQLTEENMRRLALALGCEPWEVLEEAPLLSASGKQLLKVLEALDDERLQTLLTLVRQMRP